MGVSGESMYPRVCIECNSAPYKDRQAFNQHKKRGTCAKRILAKQREYNISAVHGDNIVYNVQGDQINTINNYNLPDWLAEHVKRSDQTIRELASLVKELEEKQGIKGKDDTDFYIRKEVYGYSDYKDALEKNTGEAAHEHAACRLHIDIETGGTQLKPLNIEFFKFIEIRAQGLYWS